MPNTPGVVIGKRTVVRSEPVPGGGHRSVTQKLPVYAPQVQVVHPQPHRTMFGKVAGAATGTPTRLGTPVAFLMIGGLVLVYYALHGWDKKYGTFGGAFAGKGALPKTASTAATQAVATAPTKKPSTTQTS